MPSAARAGALLRRGAPAPVVLHSAPLVLPIVAEPLRDAAVAVRRDRVLQVGPRKRLLAAYPAAQELRWPGMIVAGLTDAFATGITPEFTTIVPPEATTPTSPGGAFATVAAPGVTTRVGLGGSFDLVYLEVSCPDEQAWELSARDALITAIRDSEHPVGVAAHSPDPHVLEDLALLARTFGLRVVADLNLVSPAQLDEAGVLGPHCHVACSGQLDPGERKLLRLRQSITAITPGGDAPALLDDGDLFAFGGDPLAQASALRSRRPAHARRLVEAATLGGATALGRDRGPGRIGSLGPGSRADFAVFDARGRHPYSALLDHAPCLATVVAGVIRQPAVPLDA